MLACPACHKALVPGSTRCTYCGASVPGAPVDGGDLEPRIRELLHRGQKLEAIKLYREQTGCSLLVAKNSVDALDAQRTAAAPGLAISAEQQAEIVRLLRTGQKLQAVKYYKELTGANLMESKQAVEAIASRHGIPDPKTGCLLGALLALLGQS